MCFGSWAPQGPRAKPPCQGGASCADAKLAALTKKGRLGEVDAFVSHSWHDDPAEKWAALQELG